MPYFDAVINEAMRLKPVAPFLGLEAIEDLVVGDVEVPKGTWIDVMLRTPALAERPGRESRLSGRIRRQACARRVHRGRKA